MDEHQDRHSTHVWFVWARCVNQTMPPRHCHRHCHNAQISGSRLNSRFRSRRPFAEITALAHGTTPKTTSSREEPTERARAPSRCVHTISEKLICRRLLRLNVHCYAKLNALCRLAKRMLFAINWPQVNPPFSLFCFCSLTPIYTFNICFRYAAILQLVIQATPPDTMTDINTAFEHISYQLKDPNRPLNTASFVDLCRSVQSLLSSSGCLAHPGKVMEVVKVCSFVS